MKKIMIFLLSIFSLSVKSNENWDQMCERLKQLNMEIRCMGPCEKLTFLCGERSKLQRMMGGKRGEEETKFNFLNTKRIAEKKFLYALKTQSATIVAKHKRNSCSW